MIIPRRRDEKKKGLPLLFFMYKRMQSYFPLILFLSIAQVYPIPP